MENDKSNTIKEEGNKPDPRNKEVNVIISKVEYSLLKDLLFRSLAFDKKKFWVSKAFHAVGLLIVLAYLYITISILNPNLMGSASGSSGEGHIAIVELKGMIAESEHANAYSINESLVNASKDPNTRAIVINITSGGGSPVQSDYIYKKIKQIKASNPDIPIVSVINEIGASGAYYVASATDYIYTNENSLVGSIGVISGSFGFTGLMEKLGVERRLYTSGKNKSFLDPFSPQKEEHVVKWEKALKNTHEVFISRVKAGRGDRLKITDDTFSGEIWGAKDALEMGLIDGYKSIDDLLFEYNVKDKIVYNKKTSPFFERFGINIGHGFGKFMINEISSTRQQLQ